MRTIKFRGRAMNGDFVYGLLTKKKIRSSGEIRWAIATGNCTAAETVPVNENSIAQLVGYDKAGNEVYEGDKILIDDAGEDEFFATCLPVGVNHWGGCFLHGGNFIFTKEFSLKEACQNPWNALQEIDSLIERHVEEAKQ